MDNDIEHLISERIAKNTVRKINIERYQNDPVYRERIKATAAKWNTDHPERRSAISKRYAKKNGAAAQKRYRQRKKKANVGTG